MSRSNLTLAVDLERRLPRHQPLAAIEPPGTVTLPKKGIPEHCPGVFSLSSPPPRFVESARFPRVPAERVGTLEALRPALEQALSAPGPP